jgi:hypothetical protein
MCLTPCPLPPPPPSHTVLCSLFAACLPLVLFQGFSSSLRMDLHCLRCLPRVLSGCPFKGFGLPFVHPSLPQERMPAACRIQYRIRVSKFPEEPVVSIVWAGRVFSAVFHPELNLRNNSLGRAAESVVPKMPINRSKTVTNRVKTALEGSLPVPSVPQRT